MKKALAWTKENPWIFVPVLLVGYYLYSQLFNALAQRHFDNHCELDAGEFIYKTVDDVEGVFQMRLREPEDYFDNLRHYRKGRGELLEDPFGHINSEAQGPERLFVSPPYSNYKFLESRKSPNRKDDRYRKTNVEVEPIDNGYPYWIYEIVGKNEKGFIYSVENSDNLISRYGFTWQEVRDKWDKYFDIWGGELFVKDLKTGETLAIRRGYFSFKYGICPRDKDVDITYQFVSKVLKPINKVATTNQGER